MTVSSKVILLVVVLIIIGGVAGLWLSGVLFKEAKWSFTDDVLENLPLAEKERAIKNDSFVAESKDEIAQFVVSLYDEGQNEFKIDTGSSPTLAATYYGVQALQALKRNPDDIVITENMFDKIRSYYASGYYLEDDKDPIFSTAMALAIDSQYQEDLNQVINLTWLESNSFENENLYSSRLDPQYQKVVLDIYHSMKVDQEELETRIKPIYLSYYCIYSSDKIADKDYLRKKYYQTSIISYLTGFKTTSSNCLAKEDVDFDKEKLSKIRFQDLNDIKEIFWLYHLQKFYNLKPDLKTVFGEIEKFYTGGGFKEKLSDQEPNLIGTYYGVSFIK